LILFIGDPGKAPEPRNFNELCLQTPPFSTLFDRKHRHKILDPWADQGDVAAVLRIPFGNERREAWRKLNPKIGRKNQFLIDECDVIFAVLDGTDVDSGTAAEIGYGFCERQTNSGLSR
jgi:Nucleoside 2-deoxyribosyltransferase